MGFCLSSCGNFFLSLRSFICIWFLMTFLFQCTYTRFCLFLISLGCFLKAVANYSMLFGLARTGLVFCLAAPISSLCDFDFAFFTIVDIINHQSQPTNKGELGWLGNETKDGVLAACFFE